MAPTTDEDVARALQELNDYKAFVAKELLALNQAFMDEATAVWQATNPRKRNKPKGWLKKLPECEALLNKHQPGFQTKFREFRDETIRLEARLKEIAEASPWPDMGEPWDGSPIKTFNGVLELVDGKVRLTRNRASPISP